MSMFYKSSVYYLPDDVNPKGPLIRDEIHPELKNPYFAVKVSHL